MRNTNRTWLGAAAGAAVVIAGAVLMGQGSGQPPKDPTQPPTTPTPIPSRPEPMLGRGEFFVTGDAHRASLWMRDGTSLRWVASADAGKGDVRTPERPATPERPSNPTNPK